MIKIGLTSYTPRKFSVSYIVLFPHAGNHDDSMVTVTVFGTAILVDPFLCSFSFNREHIKPSRQCFAIFLYTSNLVKHTQLPFEFLTFFSVYTFLSATFQNTPWPTKLIVNECTVCRDGKSSHCRQVAVVGECPLAGARLYLEV